MTTEPDPAVTLPWLVRLRWLFLVGQLVVLPAARWGYGTALAWAPIAVALGVAALSNLAIARWTARPPWSPSRIMGCALLLDSALLTTLLAASGGAMNPFTVFYLVHITLSAVVLGARWTIAIAALSIASFGGLFLEISPASMMHHDMHGMTNHLHGMWFAFVLAAVLTAVFVRRIAMAIAVQREQIAALREGSARNARLAALTTLAAGAAHELNSPLGTIAVAAHEANLRAAVLGDARIGADLALILAEVDRCQGILHQMAARAAEAEDAAPLALTELAARLRTDLGERAARVDIAVAAEAVLHVPAAQLVQALAALVKNALDASTERVAVAMTEEGGDVAIAIEDRGPAIPAAVLAKIGEPFFTTKPPGAGLGLGVFLARAFFESRGGELALASTPTGTRALVRLRRGVR